jgi:APA family basic amino acid/polyamine antiporter
MEFVPTATPEPSLNRQLGLIPAAAVVVGEVIAVGIFLTPAEMSKSIGSPAIVAGVWLVIGAMSTMGALCFGELAARYPEAGGGYIYLREAFGPRIAFLYGWKCFLVLDPGLTAALAVGLAGYLSYIVRLSHIEVKLVAIAVILGVALANVFGVRFGAFLTESLTLLKLGTLIFLAGWALGLQRGDWSHFEPLVQQRPGSAPLSIAIGGGLMSAFFAFGGWWDVSKLGGEVKDPARTLPRALILGILTVTLVYLATSAIFLYLVPVERVTSGETFAAQAGEALFGPVGGLVFSCIVIVSVLGSMAAMMMAAPRVYYAMARDGLFLSAAAVPHSRFGTPIYAIGLQAAVASILVASGTFGQIVAYFIFVTVAFVALTVAGLFVLRKKDQARLSYKTPGYPATAIIFVALMFLLLIILAARNPAQALIGAGVVGVGALVYPWTARRANSGYTPQSATVDGEELGAEATPGID